MPSRYAGVVCSWDVRNFHMLSRILDLLIFKGVRVLDLGTLEQMTSQKFEENQPNKWDNNLSLLFSVSQKESEPWLKNLRICWLNVKLC